MRDCVVCARCKKMSDVVRCDDVRMLDDVKM